MIRGLVERAIDAGDAYRTDTEVLLDGVLPDIGDTRAKASAFWVLVTCSAIIASCGLLMDSTAVVIGAMVIAPLGVPIYGLAAAVTTGVHAWPAMRRVIGGVALSIAIGAIVELATFERFVVDSNPQILARVNPTLLDLLVAIATGLAGSMALVRTDISPALPGVAIAISLVPPLTTVGITLASGEPYMALGALLLFTTNMVAIVLAGLLVFASARLKPPFSSNLVHSRFHRPIIIWSTVVTVALLAVGTTHAIRLLEEEVDVRQAAERFAEAEPDWQLESVVRQHDDIVVVFVSETTDVQIPRLTQRSRLFRDVERAGLDVVVEWNLGQRVDL